MPDRPRILINIGRFWAGATPREIIDTLLADLEVFFEFVISDTPQVVLYGPYPGTMPRGRYTKVFIGCENLWPRMAECDWAFGVINETLVRHPRYMRIKKWANTQAANHGTWDLVQPQKDWQQVLRAKTRFCAFIYAHQVFYREAFCRALSHYKKVDAPGRSLNNMPGIDPVPGIQDWTAKIAFLRQYKFVIAFENGSRAGYHTEKLSHAIEADCMPIYWGDPELGKTFNVKRILNAHDFLPKPVHFLPRLPFDPHALDYDGKRTFAVRAIQRINSTLSDVEQHVWALGGFERLVRRVTQLDRDDELYLQHLREPFLFGNQLPDLSGWIARWREIFQSALAGA